VDILFPSIDASLDRGYQRGLFDLGSVSTRKRPYSFPSFGCFFDKLILTDCVLLFLSLNIFFSKSDHFVLFRKKGILP